MKTWARLTSTNYPYLAVTEFVSGLVVVLMLALAAEVYVLLPDNHVSPGTTLLVLFLGSWMGVLGLVSAMLVPVVPILRTAVGARRSRTVLEALSPLRVHKSAEQPYWETGAPPSVAVSIRGEDTDLASYEPVAVGPESEDHFATVSERQGCECVSR